MQSSIKQVIYNAFIKVSSQGSKLAEPTADEARDEFVARLLAELFPEGSSVEISKVKVKDTDAGSVTSEKKKRGPMSDEAKAAMKAKRDATIAAKKAAEPAPEVKEIETDAESATTTEKKKRGPMSEEAKAAMKAKREATIAAKKAADPTAEVEVKKVKKVKEAKPVDAEANLAKIDATWRKYLKKAAGEKATKEMEAQLLTFLNAMNKDAFNGSKAEEHIKAFLEPKDDGKVETDMVAVDFKGKEYFVNPANNRVYEGEGEYDEEVGWTNYKAVGYVGMAAFAEMEMDI
jgi:hypothetical protein